MEDPSYRKLLEYSMRALSMRAHTVHELRIKLKKRKFHTQAHEDKVITRLLELNLLNDEDYIRRKIETAINFRLHGLRKVQQTLYPKGISPKEVKKIWDSLKIDESKIAQAALKKHERRFHKATPEKLYIKKAKFLASRGFSPEIVYSLALAKTKKNF